MPTQSDILTVEQTLIDFLEANLSTHPYYALVGTDISGLGYHLGGRDLLIKTPAIIVEMQDPWEVVTNPNWMAGPHEDTGTCAIIGMLERNERERQELDIRYLAVAILQTLNSVKAIVDTTSGQELVGWARRLQIKQNTPSAELFVESNKDRVFRTCKVEYEFMIAANA
jgi:hypothetical protein